MRGEFVVVEFVVRSPNRKGSHIGEYQVHPDRWESEEVRCGSYGSQTPENSSKGGEHRRDMGGESDAHGRQTVQRD